jgi:hypothetical protein
MRYARPGTPDSVVHVNPRYERDMHLLSTGRNGEGRRRRACWSWTFGVMTVSGWRGIDAAFLNGLCDLVCSKWGVRYGTAH